MKQLSSLIIQKREEKKRAKATERGELLVEFLHRLLPSWDDKYGKLTIPRIAKRLKGVKTKDLYYLRSVCADAARSADQRRAEAKSAEERQRIPTAVEAYAKRFFWETNPAKHARPDYQRD